MDALGHSGLCFGASDLRAFNLLALVLVDFPDDHIRLVNLNVAFQHGGYPDKMPCDSFVA